MGKLVKFHLLRNRILSLVVCSGVGFSPVNGVAPVKVVRTLKMLSVVAMVTLFMLRLERVPSSFPNLTVTGQGRDSPQSPRYWHSTLLIVGIEEKCVELNSGTKE